MTDSESFNNTHFFQYQPIREGALHPVEGHGAVCHWSSCSWGVVHPSLAVVADAVAGHRAKEHPDAVELEQAEEARATVECGERLEFHRGGEETVLQCHLPRGHAYPVHRDATTDASWDSWGTKHPVRDTEQVIDRAEVHS